MKIPVVRAGFLYEEAAGQPVAVGSASWFDWLEADTTRSFAYKGYHGNFTARKERRTRGTSYWVAYQSQGGRLQKRYIGKSEGLTTGACEAIVAAFTPGGEQAVSHAGQAQGRFFAIPQSKVSVPALPAPCITRDGLERQIAGSLDRGVTVVTAPAGYGKTTVLSQLAGRVRGWTAWISLEASDNDPAYFLASLIAALELYSAGGGRDARAILQMARQPDSDAILTVLLNDIAGGTGGLLVIDNLHEISSPVIFSAIQRLVDYLPPVLRVCLISRTDPPIALDRLRLQGVLSEYGHESLRLTRTEMQTYLQEVLAFPLTADDEAAIERRVDGWFAGLQLVALSLREGGTLQTIVEAVSGSNRYVASYLTGEVLLRQPPDVQAFLLAVSILPRLHGSLCDAVSGRQDSARLLDRLAAGNQFLQRTDSGWYRFHPLFGDLLLDRLRATHPDVAELHRRAAGWCEEAGQLSDAVDQAFAAGDFDDAARLMAGIAAKPEQDEGLSRFRDWLEQLPDRYFTRYPRLILARTWVLILQEGDMEAAGRTLDQFDALLNDSDLQGERAVLQSTVSISQHDVEGAIAHSQRALLFLPEDALFLRGVVAVNLGTAHWWKGDLVTAGIALEDAVESTERAGSTIYTIVALVALGHLREMEGRLRSAATTHQRAIRLAASHGLHNLRVVGSAHLRLAGVLLEQDDLDGAERHLALGREIGQRCGSITLQLGSALVEARLARALGDDDRGWTALDLAGDIVPERQRERWKTTAETWSARIGLSTPEALPAPRLDAGYDLINDDSMLGRVEPAGAVAIVAYVLRLIAAGRFRDALDNAEWFESNAQTTHRIDWVIEARILKAHIFEAAGVRRRAVHALYSAVTLAAPQGYVTVFRSWNWSTRPVLEEIRANPGARRYFRQIDRILGIDTPTVTAIVRAIVPLEPLSAREHEVLTLIAEGLSNAEIADRLVIALSTVKTHVNTVFGKLRVRSRTQAVAAGRRYGILPT